MISPGLTCIFATLVLTAGLGCANDMGKRPPSSGNNPIKPIAGEQARIEEQKKKKAEARANQCHRSTLTISYESDRAQVVGNREIKHGAGVNLVRFNDIDDRKDVTASCAASLSQGASSSLKLVAAPVTVSVQKTEPDNRGTWFNHVTWGCYASCDLLVE